MNHHFYPNNRLEKVISFIVQMPPAVQLLVKLTVKLLILLLRIAAVRLFFILIEEGVREGAFIWLIGSIRLSRISFKLKRFWLEWVGSIEQIDRLNQEFKQQLAKQNLQFTLKLIREIQELQEKEIPPVVQQALWEVGYISLEELQDEFNQHIQLGEVEHASELAYGFSRAYCQSKKKEKDVFRIKLQ